MASVFGSFGKPSLMVFVLLAASGCGESFVANTGGGGSGASGGDGGSTSTVTSTGGSGGTTTTASGECTDGEKRGCYEGPPGTKDIGICKAGLQECSEGAWGACEGQVFPKAEELCNDDGKDEDCDGSAEEGCGCATGTSEDCYGGDGTTIGVGPCKVGTKTCTDGVWGECEGQVIPTDEVCDLIDNDCNSVIDDSAQGTGEACETGLPGLCAMGTTYCGESTPGIVCVKDQGPVDEICDGHDNNCDDAVDNLPFESCQIAIPGKAETCGGSFKCAGNAEMCSPFFYFFDNFSEQNGSWVKGNEWDIGAMPATIAAPGQGNPDPSTDFTPNSNDNELAGVVLGGNAGQVLHGFYYLTSKAINTAEAPTLYLSYARWLNTGPHSETPHTVEVSSDGVNFAVIWQNGMEPIYDNKWNVIVHNVSIYKSPTFKVRFGFAVSQVVQLASISSWNIDDVGLSSCPPPGVAF